MHTRSIVTVLLAGLLWLALPCSAEAAESYDSCKGYVTSLPATITTSGTWCLKQNLSTLASTGSGINITAKDVTLDCNDFLLDNSVVGAGTQAVGVRAVNVANTTVRHCNIRGFQYGIYVYGTKGGNLVEDNHLDSNTYTGILLHGDGSIIRRNVIVRTGGSSIIANAQGIYTGYSVDILDNTVAGVSANSGDAFGIRTSFNASGSVSSNRVRNVTQPSAGVARGIANYNSGRMTVSGNTVSGNGGTSNVGILCSGPSGRAKSNVVVGFPVGITQCGDAGSNDVAP
jgi:parallel beta-helix repeat (two copies)